MFKRSWLNGFTFGVIAGFLLTPALIFAAIFFGISPSDFSQSNDQPNGGEQTNPEDDRWWLIRRVVYMDDTAAQWVMMFATIFAAYLLLRTLWTTQQMAADTQRIGEAQSRAYVTFSDVTFSIVDGPSARKIKVNALWDVLGQSPALSVAIDIKAEAFPQSTEVDFKKSLGERSTSRDYGNVERRKIGTVDVDLDVLEKDFIDGKAFWLLFYLEYKDVFGSAFYYSEKIKLTPTRKDQRAFMQNNVLNGVRINSEGIWGKIEDKSNQ
ncbi:MAG: hypothetical protein ACSHXH_02320 [Marivita sp.]|uniref:hypothetical protein n=1 Tax=Marivita sp. TaxID=2003365 RepID=UPI003EF30A8B